MSALHGNDPQDTDPDEGEDEGGAPSEGSEDGVKQDQKPVTTK